MTCFTTGTINAILIVVLASLFHMWETEIRDKVQAWVFRVMVYHGPSRPKDPSVLLSYNIITTYNIVGIESNSLTTDIQELREHAKKGRTASSTALFQLYWKRIVLDEGHNIRNPKSQRSIGCSSLSADLGGCLLAHLYKTSWRISTV